MEIFDFERHMNDFLKNKIAVNCPTEEDAIHFLKILEDEYGIKWRDDLGSLEDWKYYEEKTVYLRLHYGPVKVVDENYICYQYNLNSNSNQNFNIKKNSNVKQTKKRRIFIIEE